MTLVHQAVDIARGLILALVSRGRVAGLRPIYQAKAVLPPVDSEQAAKQLSLVGDRAPGLCQSRGLEMSGYSIIHQDLYSSRCHQCSILFTIFADIQDYNILPLY